MSAGTCPGATFGRHSVIGYADPDRTRLPYGPAAVRQPVLEAQRGDVRVEDYAVHRSGEVSVTHRGDMHEEGVQLLVGVETPSWARSSADCTGRTPLRRACSSIDSAWPPGGIAP
jgi:hypothetical protein